LFPSDPLENQELHINNLSADDFDSSFLPLIEPESTEGVMRPSVAEITNVTNEDTSLAPEPETEEANIIPNKKRTRSFTTTDKSPAGKKNVIPENWKRTKAKVAYNAGLPHVSKTGQVKKARNVRPPCPETCRQKCFPRVSHVIRQQLFDKYWTLHQRKTSQWLFFLAN